MKKLRGLLKEKKMLINLTLYAMLALGVYALWPQKPTATPTMDKVHSNYAGYRFGALFGTEEY